MEISRFSSDGPLRGGPPSGFFGFPDTRRAQGSRFFQHFRNSSLATGRAQAIFSEKVAPRIFGSPERLTGVLKAMFLFFKKKWPADFWKLHTSDLTGVLKATIFFQKTGPICSEAPNV